MATAEASVKIRQIVITPAGGEPVLLVEIEIACPVCGEYLIQLHGHHLKGIVEELQQILQERPALVGTGTSRTVGQIRFSGVVAPDKIRDN